MREGVTIDRPVLAGRDDARRAHLDLHVAAIVPVPDGPKAVLPDRQAGPVFVHLVVSRRRDQRARQAVHVLDAPFWEGVRGRHDRPEETTTQSAFVDR